MKRVWKIRLGILVGLLLALILTVALIVRQVGKAGSGPVEQWVRGQILAIAGERLNAELLVEDFDYQYPLTVELDKVALRADDPAHPGQKVTVLSVAKLTLKLAAIPRYGQTIQIASLTLEQPELSLIAVGPESSELVGLSNLVKKPAGQAENSVPAGPAGQERARLSEVFQIREIRLRDAKVVYDSRRPGAQPMVLDNITTDMGVTPGSGAWYGIDTKVVREPVFNLAVQGRINLDEGTLDIVNMALAMTLGREQDKYLPPQLQQVLREHEVRGQLTLQGSGVLPDEGGRGPRLDAQLELRDGNFSSGEYRVPIEHLQLNLHVAEQLAQVTQLQIQALDGRIAGKAQAQLQGQKLAEAQLTLDKLQIQRTLRAAEKGKEGELPYAGTVSGVIDWRAPLPEALTQSAGGGKIDLVDGRITKLPVLAQITELMRGLGREKGAAGGDAAQVEFQFAGDHLQFSRIDVNGGWFALRGDGAVGFDQSLNLEFNGGPVEKVQQMLGKVGEVVGVITDQLAAYHVTGTLGEPKVSMKLAPAAGKGVKGAIEGLQKLLD